MDEYTELFLKYRRSKKWLEEQATDLKNKEKDMDAEKLKKSKAWLNNQLEEYDEKVCAPLDKIWQSFTEDEQNEWEFNNAKLLEGLTEV